MYSTESCDKIFIRVTCTVLGLYILYLFLAFPWINLSLLACHVDVSLALWGNFFSIVPCSSLADDLLPTKTQHSSALCEGYFVIQNFSCCQMNISHACATTFFKKHVFAFWFPLLTYRFFQRSYPLFLYCLDIVAFNMLIKVPKTKTEAQPIPALSAVDATSYTPYTAIEHLKCGYCDGGAKFLNSL